MDTKPQAARITAETRISSRGQVTVPAAIQRKLGVASGSMLQWIERGDEVVVRKRGEFTFDDIHKAIFPDGPPRRQSLIAMKQGIADFLQDKHGHR